jgi:hypothetical protein
MELNLPVVSVLPGFGSIHFTEFTDQLRTIFKITLHMSIFKNFHVDLYRDRDRVAGIAIVYRLDDQGVGVRTPVVSRIFSFLFSPDRV